MAHLSLLLVVLTLLSVLALSLADAPQSLSPTMSLRQFRQATSVFRSFGDLNRRRRRNRRLRRQCRRDGSFVSQFRTLSGYCNNRRRPADGAADTPFIILAKPLRRRFEARELPNARRISNIVCQESAPRPNRRGMSELVTFFGQLIDHTVTETFSNENRPFRIRIPRNDPIFKGSISQNIPFFRTTTRGRGDNRAPVNELSSYIDAASIYGVDEELAMRLRTKSAGKMSLPGNLLIRGPNGFLSGDSRVNENPNLTGLHLLFTREHNRVADEVIAAYPTFNDEQIYQLARHIVAAEFQAVVWYGFLPALTGRPLGRYTGYKPRVRAIISSRFSTAGFRVGHTLLNRTVNSVDAHGKWKSRMLRDSFFNPDAFVQDGLDNLLRGMMYGHASEVDNGITEEVRSFLLDSTPSQEEQLDLAALNIQRGRDHGLPLCNDVRRSLGLRPFTSFRQINPNINVRRKLRLAYRRNVDNVDTWICGISEKHVRGSSLGSTFNRIIRREFARLRDGDRFYFERPGYFKADQIAKIKTIRELVGLRKNLGAVMRNIIVRNTGIPNSQVKSNPFFV